MIGYIKLHRSLTDWEWYSDITTTRLLIHLLLTVNYKDNKWRGITVKAGTIITSVLKLSTQLDLTPKTIRVHLDRLVDSGEVERITTNKYTLLSLTKWEQLQIKDTVKGKQEGKPSNEQRANNLPTTKEDKNREEGKEYYIEAIQFLSDWAKVRLHFDGKPTNIKKLTTFESVNFNKLKHLFTRDEFRAAIQGMFEQKNMYASTRLRPTHFLDDGNLEKYLDCKINKIKLFKDD